MKSSRTPPNCSESTSKATQNEHPEMANQTDPNASRPCSIPGCKAWAVRGTTTCRSHTKPPPNPTGGTPPSRQRHGAYTRIQLPDNPTFDDLIKALAARFNAIQEYAQQHPEDTAAQNAANDALAKIARMIRDKAKLTGQQGQTLGELIAQCLDLILPETQ